MDGYLSTLSGEFYYSLAAFFSGSAYLLRNILWLRILLVVAALVYIVSGSIFGITAMVGWNLAYLLINCYHIAHLLLDRLTFALPPETRAIYRRYFATLSTRDFKKLVVANPFAIFQDEAIVSEGEVPDRLYLVLRGKVDIVKRGRRVATLGPGDFIGEMSFLGKQPASASAAAGDLVQCACWTHADLARLEQRRLDTYNKFIAILGRDLVRKLDRGTNERLEQITRLDYVV